MSEGPVESVNPRGFKVAEGYVEVKADVDERDVRRSAHHVTNIVEDTGRRRRRGFFKTLFTPDADILSALRTGIPSVLGTPITAAAITLAGVFALGFVGALAAAFITAGIATVFLGLGAFIVSQNSKIAKKLIEAIGKDLKALGKEITEPLVLPILITLARFRVLLRDVRDSVGLIFGSLADTITPITTAVFEFIRILADGLAGVMPAFGDILVAIAEELPGLSESIVVFFEYFAEHKDEIIEMVGALFSFTNWIIRIAGPVIIALGEILVELRDHYRRLGTGVQLAVGVISRVLNFMETAILGWRELVRRAIDKVKEAWNNLPKSIRTAISSVVTTFATLPVRLMMVIIGLPQTMYNAGKTIISSLVRGIRDSIPSVESIMQMVGHVIGNFVPGSPVKQGPLMVFNNPETNPGGKLADMFMGGFVDRMRSWQFPPGMTPAVTTPNVTVSPNIESPPLDVRVYLDGAEITKRVEVTVTKMNRQIKRAVRSGGRRLP